MPDETTPSSATPSRPSSSSPVSLPAASASSTLVEALRVLAPIAGAVVLCALGKIPPEAALAVLAAQSLPAEPRTLLRLLLGKGPNP